jgi:hypothetical protein
MLITSRRTAICQSVSRSLVDRCGSLGSCKLQIKLIKPIGKRPSGIPRRGWEENIRMDLKNIGMRNSVDLAQDRGYWRALVNVALNLRVPYAMELLN